MLPTPPRAPATKLKSQHQPPLLLPVVQAHWACMILQQRQQQLSRQQPAAAEV
jgi:hypothetical protein